jgi:hypothetical protein
MNDDIEATIGALSIVAAPYAALSGILRDEFPNALAMRYGLTESQKAWCSELLEDQRSVHRDLCAVDEAMGGIGAGEYQFLWDLVDWFMEGMQAKLAFLEEMGNQGYVPAERPRLFPATIVDAFDLVGVAPTFDESAVISAFRKTMGLIHPDPVKAAGLNSDEVQRAGELSVRTIQARLRIMNFYRSLRGA